MCLAATGLYLLVWVNIVTTWVSSLNLEKVSIPQYGVKEGSVLLICDFRLGSDKLLNLKWYKDGHEFFRYSPQLQTNPILTFPVDGVIVDMRKSALNQVILKNISLESSGTYKCEVSADRPSFRTLSSHGEMIVIAPPKSEPRITGLPWNRKVNIGDIVNCNCTSGRSKPAASLMFYINSEKADTTDIAEYLPIPHHSGLEVASLGLSFQVRPNHFRDGILELKCTATIGNSYWVATETLRQVGREDLKRSPGHKSFFSGGPCDSTPAVFVTIFLPVMASIVV